MPKILRRISWYLPCTAACQAMRDIMAKGWDISNSSIPIGIGASISWICIFVFASWIAMKFKSRWWCDCYLTKKKIIHTFILHILFLTLKTNTKYIDIFSKIAFLKWYFFFVWMFCEFNLAFWQGGYFTANYEVINYFMRIFSKDKKNHLKFPLTLLIGGT